MTKTDFPYNTSVVSAKQFETHTSLYGRYIDKANEIAARLSENAAQLHSGANAIYSPYRALKKEQAFAVNSAVLHELYFENMSRPGSAPGDSTVRLLTAGFGSLAEWRADFTACAMAARGWCITSFSQRQTAAINNLLDAHDIGFMALSFPLIALDMYEHAYFMDDGADKAAYIARFLDGIDWDIVEARAWAVESALSE